MTALAPGVLLSASYPSAARRVEYRAEESSQDIGLAVAGVAEAVLERDLNLVFGGHPTISPVVLNIALLLNARQNVTIYQSRFFGDEITPEVWRLIEKPADDEDHGAPARIGWVEAGADKDDSVRLMREAMLMHPLAAAFYIGGMSGIARESESLERVQPHCKKFVFTQPGGRAADIAEDADPDFASERMKEIRANLCALNKRGYLSLAHDALDLALPKT